MLHFQGAGSSNEVSCFHRFTCSIRSNSHCSTGMFTRVWSGHLCTAIGRPVFNVHFWTPDAVALPKDFLPAGHFWTPTCAALTKESSQPFVRYSATFCVHLQPSFLSRLADGVPSQPCGQVVWLFVAHRFPPLADQFPFAALPTAAPRPPVCSVPFSTSGAECSHARHHRFPRGGLRRSLQNCRSRTHTR